MSGAAWPKELKIFFSQKSGRIRQEPFYGSAERAPEENGLARIFLRDRAKAIVHPPHEQVAARRLNVGFAFPFEGNAVPF